MVVPSLQRLANHSGMRSGYDLARLESELSSHTLAFFPFPFSNAIVIAQLVSSLFLGVIDGSFPFALHPNRVMDDLLDPVELSSAGHAPGGCYVQPDHDARADSPALRFCSTGCRL
jgi:hypothetical protein